MNILFFFDQLQIMNIQIEYFQYMNEPINKIYIWTYGPRRVLVQNGLVAYDTHLTKTL